MGLSVVQKSTIAVGGLVLSTALLVGSLLGLIGDSFAKLCTGSPVAKAEGYTGCLSPLNIFGLYLYFVSAFALPYFFGLCLHFSRHWQYARLSSALFSSLLLALAAWAMAVLCRPQDTSRIGLGAAHDNPLSEFLGALLVALYVPFGCAGLLHTVTFRQARAIPETFVDTASMPLLDDPTTVYPDESVHLNQKSRVTRAGFSPLNNLLNYAALMSFIAAIFIFNASFPATWSNDSWLYFPLVSPFSLVDGSVNSTFRFKVYLDSVVYFGFILGLIFLATLARFVPALHHFLRHRIRIIPHSWHPQSSESSRARARSSANTTRGRLVRAAEQYKWQERVRMWWRTTLLCYPLGASVGELIVVASTVALYGFWLWYWRWKYTRIMTDAYEPGPLAMQPMMQVWTRVIGHLANLSLSLMLYPVAHNHSVLERVFGMPFERALRYHRVLGALAWLFVTLHGFLWWIKWAIDGILWRNVVSIDYLQIDPNVVHYNNFTVVFAEMAWLVLTLGLLIAIFFRRTHYEFFYRSHQLMAAFFFFAALLHAWAIWFYVLPGLLLWVFDRCSRLRLSAGNVTLARVEFSHGVTRVEFPRSVCHHRSPGQYVFVQFPELRWGEWHPFSLSSSPSSDLRTVHIKGMGRGTFTEDLASWAEGRGMPAAGSLAFVETDTGDDEDTRSCDGARKQMLPPVEIAIDGPYGTVTYDGYKQLLLVAGGIGITPLHSILEDIVDRIELGEQLPFEHVRLVWCCRDERMLLMFSPTFERVARLMGAKTSQAMNGMGGPLGSNTVRFTLSLYATHGEIEAPSMAGTQTDGWTFSSVPTAISAHWLSQIDRHRPHLESIFQEAHDSFSVDPRETKCLACGPATLVSEVSELTFKHGFDFHSEVFLF